MTCTIQKHIMAIILAGAMLLFMGFAVQTAYADQTDSGYTVDYSSINTVSIALPGVGYDLTATIKKDGKEVGLPEGARCEWDATPMSAPGLTPEMLEGFASIEPYEGDSTKAILQFADLPDGVSDITVGLSVKVVRGEGENVEVICESNVGQMLVQNGFYEVLFPMLDPELMVQKPVKVSAQVLYHTVSSGEDAADVVEPCEAECTWNIDDESVLQAEPGERAADGSYPFTITRLRADVECNDTISLTVKYGPDLSQTQYYPLYKYSIPLKNCSIGIAKGTYHTVISENWCFIDEVAAKKAGKEASLSSDSVYVHAPKDTVKQQFNDKLFELVNVQKYTGYSDSTYEDVFQKSSFPLKFDAKKTKDRNGIRTDGTAFYKFQIKGKSGSGWTGTTDYMYLFVCSKYSLYNFDEYYTGDITFTKLGKYLKEWSNAPYFRYEIPKGNKTAKTLRIKLGGSKLTPGKEVTVRYRDDATKKEYKSFPTAAGEYTLVVTGISPYYGKIASTHIKIGAKNTLTVKGKTIKVKAKKKKVKKTKTYKVSKAITVKKARGAVTFKKLSGNKKITVSKTGKVTVKKGLKKGTYKVKVSVKAAGNAKYFPITKKVTFKVKVK